MTKNNKIITISIFLAISILVMCIVFIKTYNKPHVNVSEKQSDIALVANTLLADFEKDENSANTKYLEKIIEVTGTITELNTDSEDAIIALSDQDLFGSVRCYLTSEQSNKTNDLTKGQQVTIKGICTGYLMDVILVKCIIINK